MAKKYVPAGVFLTCDKGTLPTTLNVVFNARTVFHGQNVATDLDMVPQTNIPSMGVCSVSKGPCLLVPAGKWSPVKDDVQLGSGHPLLEDSQLRCGLTGCISIHFSLADAQAACPPPPAPEASVLDQLDERMKGWGPLGAYGRFQLGVAEGLWEGGKGLAEGLWGVAKGGWNAAMHPLDTAHAIGEGAGNAYQWAGDSQNWSNAAHSAGQGISDAASWASNGDNWHHVGEQLGSMSPRDWGKVTGRVGFEVGLTVATAGAGTALAAAAETSRLARAALLVARVADVEGLALNAAGRLARTAAGQMRILGKFVTGARQGRRVAQAAREARAALRASPLGRKLKGVADYIRRKRKCLWDPIDVANGVMLFDQVDWEMPGPLPFVWQRYWYSNSEYAGPLGHGWHHSFDAALLADAEQVVVRLPDGRLASFVPPTAVGERVFNRVERLELHRTAMGGYRVFSLDERRTYCFTVRPAGAAKVIVADAREEAYRLDRVEDPNGFAIQLAYDAAGYLRTLTDCAGRQVRLHCDAQGRITALEAPQADGHDFTVVVRYAYDEAGHLVVVTDALHQALRYAYRADHLLVQKTFRTGVSFYFEYAGTGSSAQCVRTWGDGNVLNGRLTFEPGRTTAHSDAPGDESSYEHIDGLLTRHTDPLGAVREYRYNQYGDLVLERNPLGQATSYTYDARGNQTRVVHPDGAKVHTQYNAQDLPIKEIDANGGIWQWQYDTVGNLLQRTDPVGATTHYGYDEWHRLAEITDAGQHSTILRYDRQHQLISVIAATGLGSSYQYDALGRVRSSTDSRGNVHRRRYDAVGRTIAVREANGVERIFVYDGEGNVLQIRDTQRTVDFTYNTLDQLATRTEAGRQIQFLYDAEGRLTVVRNERGETYTFTLDVAGQVVKEVGFDEVARTYYRDAAGQIVEVKRPGKRFTQYAYDACGRAIEVRHHDGIQLLFAYRSDGQLLEANNAAQPVRFQKDVTGQITGEFQGEHVVESTYDLVGQRSTVSSSLGANIKFERTNAGQLAKVHAATWQASFKHDSFGQEVERVLGSVHMLRQHDTWGNLTHQNVRTPQSRGRQRTYQWQFTGQLAQIQDSITGLVRFTHDAQGNLAATRYADGIQELRQPDSTGNLFRTPERTDRQYGQGGQLREANGTRYKYDEEGNLIRKTLPTGQVWQYEWNGAGQLARVALPNGYAVTFTYDALGRRVSKRYRGKVTRWVWDGDQPLHEWTELEVSPGSGSINDLTTWLFEEETFAPLAKLTATGNYSVVTDHLGTPLELYNQSGTKTWQAQLDSYGQVREGKGKPQDCPFRYQGQYEDVETGLYYNRFRYYDPEVGTYISQDPIGLNGGSKLYAYVHDPTTFTDPFGLAKCKIELANAADHDIILKLSKSDYPETAGHIEEAIGKGHPDILTINRPGAKANRKASLKGIKTKTGFDRDEWPMAMGREGGKGAHVKYIDPSDNQGAGSAVGNALRSYPDGTRVKFVIID